MESKRTIKKVAHVIGSLRVGGAERFVIDLSLAQKKQNLKPAIISLGSPADELVEVCKINKIPVASYGSNSFFKLCRVFIVLLKFDVIHVHSPHALKYISLFFPLLKRKVIYTRHGAAPYFAEPWLTFHKNIKKFVSAATFVSQEGKDNFLEHHKWQDVTTVVVDNGVLIDPVNKVPSQNNKLRIGSVGRMIPLKNQVGLLKSLSLLSDDIRQMVNVEFFGDGVCLEQLTSYKAENLPTLDVKFHGMVSDRELIYSNIDVLVVCSETEGLSMVIIEAMANKIPVIATNVGGNPKLVLNGETGWLFEYDDNEKLAEIIQHILNNKALISAIGENAFSYVYSNFSIDTSAKKYAELYQA